MSSITVSDLRYHRERSLDEELAPKIALARKSLPGLQQRIEMQVKGFFEHVATSVRVSGLPEVAELLNQVHTRFDAVPEIEMFLRQQPEPAAQCTPQFTASSKTESGLTVLLSQHFFNNLHQAERLVILGHEMGHYLFGHLGIPREPILQAAKEENSFEETVALLYKWSLCREISCDLAGLAVAGNDWKSCGLALLKFCSGVDARGVEAMGGEEALIDGMLSQYETVADSVQEGVLSTHPLVPVRLRILQAAAETGMLRRFGEECRDDEREELGKELAAAIDEVVFPVYPQLKPATVATLAEDHIILDLAMAVALADGNVDPRELSSMGRLLNHALDAEAFLQSIRDASGGDVAAMCNQLVERARASVGEQGLQKADVVALVRRVCTVAAADGHVGNEELKLLFAFVQPYGISKEELVYIAQQSVTPMPA